MKSKFKCNFIRVTKQVIIFVIIIFVSILSNKIINLSEIKLLQFDFIFTYLGIFLGFTITIYTFIISILPSINNKIENFVSESKTLEHEDHKEIKLKLKSAVNELKEGISIILIVFSLNILFNLILNIRICNYKLDHLFPTFYPTYELIVFLISFVVLLDLILSMFEIGKITTILL